MSIQSLDMNILWGKANARCALCPNKERVVAETPENKGRTDILFGDMCHIVGETASAARGVSSMPTKDRNRYHNLILLCRNHHAIIDKDVATHTVEKLHQIKTDHELWIDSRLDEETSLEDSLYRKLVNLIADQLQLHMWSTISSDAWHGELPVWFVDGTNVVLDQLARTNWPGKKRSLEAQFHSLESRLKEFKDEFLAHTELDLDEQVFRPAGYYDNEPDTVPISQEDMQKSWLRHKHSERVLWNFVVALNKFAEEVRRELDPRFFFLEGKFPISDNMTRTENDQPIVFIPTEYRR